MTIYKSRNCKISERFPQVVFLMIVINFSSHELTDNENVLCRDLTFSVKPRLAEYSKPLL